MLLDTCALLWLAAGSDQLTERARDRLRTASALYVSAITAFEVGVKCRAGKLLLPATPTEWLHAVLDHHGIAPVPLDLDICAAATELPAVHGDPCDRLIIATARLRGWPVVTADDRFRRYGIEVIW
jgi:PIN domain nuclease of toxin-antitoxin system